MPIRTNFPGSPTQNPPPRTLKGRPRFARLRTQTATPKVRQDTHGGLAPSQLCRHHRTIAFQRPRHVLLRLGRETESVAGKAYHLPPVQAALGPRMRALMQGIPLQSGSPPIVAASAWPTPDKAATSDSADAACRPGTRHHGALRPRNMARMSSIGTAVDGSIRTRGMGLNAWP